MSAMALDEFLALARDDERAALAELFRAHHRSILALCRNLTGSAAEAEDALQETFVAAHAALASFRGDSQPSTWLHRIAIRTSLRVKSRRSRPEDSQSEPSHDPRDGHLDRDALTRAMATLSAEQRAVIALFAVEGLTHAEIARILGVPEGTVWSRLHVAKRRLAELLRD